MLKLNILLVALCALFISATYAGDEDEKEDMDSFRRKTPSGQYIDAASFFRFHGYVNIGLAQVQDGLGSEAHATPQILVSGLSPQTGQNESGFKNDAAMFVGGEPLEGVGSVIEIHFVGNGLNPVLTEAKLILNILDNEDAAHHLRLMGGRYWWPFGVHNNEWFSAVNNFSVISPAAAEVVPAHYNEVGIMAEGEIRLNEGVGANYVFSVGNGVQSFELMPNVTGTAFDANGNRTVTGRFGLISNRGAHIDFGFSASKGELRAREIAGGDPEDAQTYAADFVAWGPDLAFNWNGFGFRSYYYLSRENLVNGQKKRLDRDGLTVEPMFTWDVNSESIKKVILFTRYSFANEDVLTGETYRRVQYGIGAKLRVKNALQARIGYVVQTEGKGAPKVDNNVFSLGFTAEF